MKQPWEPKIDVREVHDVATKHCDCHVIAQNDLTGAIYWLLRMLKEEAERLRPEASEAFTAAWRWLAEHGHEPGSLRVARLVSRRQAPGSPRARRLLARKRVPR